MQLRGRHRVDGVRRPKFDLAAAHAAAATLTDPAIYKDAGATLADLREAVETLEDAERIARRVLGGVHPLTTGIANFLRKARAALRAREETQPSGGA